MVITLAARLTSGVVRVARFSSPDLEAPAFGVVERAAGEETVAEIDGHPFRPFQVTGRYYPLAAVRLLAPVVPTKVVAIGKNYEEHAREMGGEAPAAPVIFLKPSTAVVGPNDPIVHPVSSQRVDYEGELAVVFGRVCRNVREQDALSYVFGYTCANDVTARDQQAADGQWARAKGYDSFCPLGPWLETELDPRDVEVSTRLNDEVRQQARTSALVHPVARLIAYVSAVMTLLPTDVLLTGTPAGVGPMLPGDEVAVRIEGIGELRNRVVSGG